MARTRPQPDSTGTASQGATEQTARADDATADDQAVAQADAKAGRQEMGNVSPSPISGPAAELPAALARTRVRDRLIARDDWADISKLAKEMRSECNRKRMTAEDREDFVWSELDRLYPPMRETASTPKSATPDTDATCEISKAQSAALLDSGRVQGLGDLPPGWPSLPANASLTAEIGWVQANRLYVVEELDRGGTRVRLDRAHEPAPSRAAIGWLETSIRSYAKYVEVAAKATGAGQDEQAQERQERLDLEDIRSLLAEMM
jgi:hypothetical protein